MRPLFELAPRPDLTGLAADFARDRRVLIPDILTPETAGEVHDVLASGTDWGLGWAAGDAPPAAVRGAELRALAPNARAQLSTTAIVAARRGDFAFVYGRYPMLDAYREGWDPGHPLDLLLEHLNAEPMLDLVRKVAAMPGLLKADAQATLYAPGHFLTVHDDSREDEGRRVAYVLYLTRDWRPDWGGYLNFYDTDGNIVAGWRPRYNALALFAVPQRHSVSFVPPFAAVGRFALTGWFRDL